MKTGSVEETGSEMETVSGSDTEWSEGGTSLVGGASPDPSLTLTLNLINQSPSRCDPVMTSLRWPPTKVGLKLIPHCIPLHKMAASDL